MESGEPHYLGDNTCRKVLYKLQIKITLLSPEIKFQSVSIDNYASGGREQCRYGESVILK